MAIEKPSIISKSIIKPSSPTPEHLRTYNLSLVDQLAPQFYMPIVLFYSKAIITTFGDNISSHLKKSLSDTLVQYYPFAGTFNGKNSIDCNDGGIDYYEARINCGLDNVLNHPDPSSMDLFSPPGSLFNESFKGSPLMVQVTHFTCGGIAISGSILHKVADACAIFGFLNDWADVARGGKVKSPTFISSLISPFNTGEIIFPGTKIDKENIITRRFSFDASKIDELKAIVRDSGIHNPTRVEVVSALIYRCAAKNISGMSRPSILMQTVNLRPRVVPPLSENSVGNFSWFFSIMSKDDSDKRLNTIVEALKEKNGEFREKYGKNLGVDECYSLLCESIKEATKVLRGNQSNNNIVVYKCSSLCRYSFADMNFGWGKPVFVGTFAPKMKNTFHLLDSLNPGGIDAVVSLEEQEMASLEIDQELLKFAQQTSAIAA